MAVAPVLFIDSGVGGLPYSAAFRELQPEAAFIYLADRLHYPYGAKSKSALINILVKLISSARQRWQTELVALVCNTASVTALDDLRAVFPDCAFVGTVPALKPAVLNSTNRRIGVLATERTTDDPYIRLLVDRYAPDCVLETVAAPELVDFVQYRYITATAADCEAVVRPYVENFKLKAVDALVLGCTHFLHLTDYFQRLAQPEIMVYDSLDGVARQIARLWSSQAKIEPLKLPEATLFVTGQPPYEASYQAFAKLYRLKFAGAAFPELAPGPDQSALVDD